jgi:Glycosyl hydrolase family 1
LRTQGIEVDGLERLLLVLTLGTVTSRAHKRRMMASDLVFPDGFVWGTATAAYQIEGANSNNDWWECEHNPNSGCLESSGDACNSFH